MIKQGEVYWIDFSGVGSEMEGIHPGCIVSNNVGNLHSPNVLAIPLSSKRVKRQLPTQVIISAYDSGLPTASVAMCENIKDVSKERIQGYICTLPNKYMVLIAMASTLSTSLISYLNEDFLIKLKKRAKKFVDNEKEENNNG